MLGFIFGFHARMGRLHYFLSCIAFGLVMTAVAFAIAAFAFRNAVSGAAPSANLIILPVLCLAPFVIWATVCLQSMRIRDIGWNPVIVVPAWLLICALDAYVAYSMPQWAIGKDHAQTLIGTLVNLFLTLALMFWPSKDDAGSTPEITEPAPRRTQIYTPPPAPVRTAAPTIRRDPTGRPRFGQRGL